MAKDRQIVLQRFEPTSKATCIFGPTQGRLPADVLRVIKDLIPSPDSTLPAKRLAYSNIDELVAEAYEQEQMSAHRRHASTMEALAQRGFQSRLLRQMAIRSGS